MFRRPACTLDELPFPQSLVYTYRTVFRDLYIDPSSYIIALARFVRLCVCLLVSTKKKEASPSKIDEEMFIIKLFKSLH